jgi:proteic killer suppression protein
MTKEACRTLPTQLHATARRKLAVIDYASDLNMLRIPPGNHLEALDGNRRPAFHSDKRQVPHLLLLE